MTVSTFKATYKLVSGLAVDTTTVRNFTIRIDEPASLGNQIPGG